MPSPAQIFFHSILKDFILPFSVKIIFPMSIPASYNLIWTYILIDNKHDNLHKLGINTVVFMIKDIRAVVANKLIIWVVGRFLNIRTRSSFPEYKNKLIIANLLWKHTMSVKIFQRFFCFKQVPLSLKIKDLLASFSI